MDTDPAVEDLLSIMIAKRAHPGPLVAVGHIFHTISVCACRAAMMIDRFDDGENGDNDDDVLLASGDASSFLPSGREAPQQQHQPDSQPPPLFYRPDLDRVASGEYGPLTAPRAPPPLPPPPQWPAAASLLSVGVSARDAWWPG